MGNNLNTRLNHTGDGQFYKQVAQSSSVPEVLPVYRTSVFAFDDVPSVDRIYEGEDDGIQMDVLNDDSPFYDFSPAITLLLIDHRSIKNYPAFMAGRDEAASLVRESADSIRLLWDRIREKLPGCQIFHTNIVIPCERPLGNLEGSVCYSRAEYLREINRELALEHPAGVTIVDMDHIAAYIGKAKWFDNAAYFMSKTG